MNQRILLVEPNYSSKFPPLGLLRISSYYKGIGVEPDFVIGLNREAASKHWDKIFISSLFTFELPRTVKTINFYKKSVTSPEQDIVVGGIAASLMPEYIRENATCRIIEGTLCNKEMIASEQAPIANLVPDYEILKRVSKQYTPENAYFARVTTGCIRKCPFCAVPILEPNFSYLQDLTSQVNQIKKLYGEKRDLVILDNNILALENFSEVIDEIVTLGFGKGAKLNGHKRNVDFNQGIDVRLINPENARMLGKLAINPVRLAFDNLQTEKSYRRGVKYLAQAGIKNIVTYVMFNFRDTPTDLFRRLQINLDLHKEFNIKITGFPMRYCPITDADRHYISDNWNWRYLRGIQCILNATHGMVSPNPVFFDHAFGQTADDFIKIVTMPDDYIVYRNANKDNSREWEKLYSNLSVSDRNEFLELLGLIHFKKVKSSDLAKSRFKDLLMHYK